MLFKWKSSITDSEWEKYTESSYVELRGWKAGQIHTDFLKQGKLYQKSHSFRTNTFV